MSRCEHGTDGKPYGYPTYPCAWPACPMGVTTTRWVIAGPVVDSFKPWLRQDKKYEREKSIDEDGKVFYTWKERK